jgi:hypothetical protein
MDPREIIETQKRLEQQDSVFRTNWQDTANYIFPRESNITDISYPGTKKTEKLYDVTAILESENMASGLLTNLVPAGQKFFSLTTSDSELEELDIVKSYWARATEKLHEELFSSNYILMLGETLRSLITFGTGCLFETWNQGLSFTDWDVSRYQVQENYDGEIDTIYLKFPKTALQAHEKWGDKAGECIIEAVKDDRKKNNNFWFIHVVRPRKNRNPRFQDSLNMAWESGYVNLKDKTMIDEGGYPEFPYQVPRWTKTSGEVHGRGIGTMILPQVKKLNVIERDFTEMSNKIANPHREVLESFEGEYNTTPGARNDVMEIPSSFVDERQFGNPIVTEKRLEMQQQVVKNAFYADAFAPITSSGPGDRRNELEIMQRIREAFRKIGSPIGRIESELFTPKIYRCYNLLVRNGVIPEAPPELIGTNLKVRYEGPLSLAQQDAEGRASEIWVEKTMAVSQAEPSAFDNVNVDSVVRRWGRVGGVNEEDIASEDMRDAKREQRRQELERQKALEAAQVAGQTYGQTTTAPEEGSAAEQMQGVA